MRSIEERCSLDFVSKFLLKYAKSVVSSRDQYSKYDLLADDVYVEVKNRRCNFGEFFKFCTDGFILEYAKYNYLRNKPSRYVNTINIGDFKFMLIWNIAKVVPNVIEKRAKAHTDFGGTGYIMKQVIMLMPEDASVIAFINGEYEHINLSRLQDILKENDVRTNI